GLVRSCYGGPSGTAGVGACRAGTETCAAGSWGSCTGQTLPSTETCDNVDNDCDASVDESLTQSCYTGPSGTSGVGLCRAGTQTCSAGSWGSTCPGEVLPGTELCDAQDNNCDGVVDEPFLSQFQLNTLTASSCVIVDHNGVTSDDRGGIAISGGSVFYTGDSQTGRMPLNLSSVSALSPSRQYDALTGDLRTEQAYTLGVGTTPLAYNGGTVTSIIPIDSAGVLNTAGTITLSTSISVPSGSGIFAGYGQILIHNGSRVYRIAIPSGAVTDLGAMGAPPSRGCESWAYWGVAETISGVNYITYVNGNAIQRMRVPTGAVTTVATFSNLGDMCTFTVSPSTGRWYFHYEGGAQFGGSSETVGYCTATFVSGGLPLGSGVGDQCTAGVGACLRTSTVVCNTAQTGTVCSVTAGSPMTEVCNGIDDDCDGVVDNGNPGGGASCSTGNVCTNGALACVGGSLSCQVGSYNNGVACSTSGSVAPSNYTLTGTSPLGWINACAYNPGNSLGDDGAQNLALPFPFRFYGTSYTGVGVNSNGWIGFPTASAGLWSHMPLPYSGLSNVVVPFWDDLYQRNPICWATLGAAPNRQFVIEWNDAMILGDSTAHLTFEVILSESTNTIDVLYQTMSGSSRVNGTNATTGIQQGTGGPATQRSYNTSSVYSGTKYRWTPTGGLDGVCSSGSCVGTGVLRFTLGWSATADLDLHVVTPCGTQVYFGNPAPGGSCAGVLDRDDTYGIGPENVFWTSAATVGSYTVCAVPWSIYSAPTSFSLGAYVNNTLAGGGFATGAYYSSGPTTVCARYSTYYVGTFYYAGPSGSYWYW
ncbi:MAG: hypothetical protein IPN17_29575, partial [Deltaproteobacteria bacterium]|nr:hypothetical protein [Deltaproteobacteria bacterium]